MRNQIYRLEILAVTCILLTTAAILAGCRSFNSPEPSIRQVSQLTLAGRSVIQEDTLTYTLSATNAADLYQMSCRLEFDQSGMEPVETRRGSLVDSRAAFLALADQPGLIPFAFTYHGEERVTTGDGSLLTVQFRITDPAGDYAVSLVDDPDYLVLRNATGQDLVFAAGGGL